MVGVLLLLIGLVLLGLGVLVSVRIGKDRNGETAISVRPGVALLMSFVLLVYAFLLAPAVGQVPAGHRGVVLQFGAVTSRILDEGLYFVTPLVNSVELMDVQTHAFHAKASAASHDLQVVSTEVTVNYRLDPSRVGTIYQTLRKDYETRILTPAVQEAVKANTADYVAEHLITKRPLVKAGIERVLQERLTVHGILVDTVNITDFDFSHEFNAAIEAKVTAEQQALKAENDLRRIKIEAQQVVAQALAESIEIRGKALRDNPALVSLEAVQKWNGVMPQIVLGDALPLISLPQLQASK